MGTTKDLIDLDLKPTETKMGEGTFLFKEFPDQEGVNGGTFSVRDYGIMPNEAEPDLIPAKGQVLCTVGALIFEYLANNEVPNHYLGVVNPDGKVVSVDQLPGPTNKMRIRVSRVIKPDFDRSLPDRYDYSFFKEAQGKMSNYVAPIEWIYRNALPDGSSKRRKILAAYEEGKMNSVYDQLKELGLKPDSLEKIMGDETVWLPEPYNEYTTKYEQDDRDLGTAKNDGKAFEISGMSRKTFKSAKKLVDKANKSISEFYGEVGEPNRIAVGHLDGKLEIAISGYPMVADVAGTPDEIRAEVSGIQVSKEPIRQWYDIFARDWSDAVKAAKKEARQRALSQWTPLVKVMTPRLHDEYRKLMGEMYQAFGNIVTYARLKQKWWPDARDITLVVKDVNSYLKGD